MYKISLGGKIYGMELMIDTRDRAVVKLAVRENGEILTKRDFQSQFGSQVILGGIVAMMQELGKGWGDIWSVSVATGAGSFTGVRVGVSVANAIAFGLGIKVNGKDCELDLQYDER